MTRSLTSSQPVSSCEMLVETELGLCERVALPREQLYRLVGVGLSNFQFEQEGEQHQATGDALLLMTETLPESI
jgi:DNA polymerase-4